LVSPPIRTHLGNAVCTRSHVAGYSRRRFGSVELFEDVVVAVEEGAVDTGVAGDAA
jgi:hypothetical protein